MPFVMAGGMKSGLSVRPPGISPVCSVRLKSNGTPDSVRTLPGSLLNQKPASRVLVLDAIKRLAAIPVAQLLIRNLSEAVVERLKARARAHDRSLQAEARRILEQAAATDPGDFWARADALRGSLAAKGARTDSTAAVREDRER